MGAKINIGAAAGAVALGTAVGVAAAFLALSRPSMGAEGGDGWSGSRYAGSTAADPLTRAVVARTGLLALARTETIYFTRSTDAEGRSLTDACRYRIDGGPLPARWWSITLYAADNYLPRNDDGALSVDATRAPRTAEGRWTAEIGPAPGPAGPLGWISNRAGGRFSLTLRLYNPAPGAAADPTRIAFPRLTRLTCRAGTS